MNTHVALEQHNIEIQRNLEWWQRKPLLQRIYRDFHELIAKQTLPKEAGLTVELGSGIGSIGDVLPHCIKTDLFDNPWIDQTENAYKLSFENNSVANLILFDVLHHLEHLGNALSEFERVLIAGGRLIIFDPCISLFGWLVYGLAHHEPVGWRQPIIWDAPSDWSPDSNRYYAAQGNATRLFVRGEHRNDLKKWEILRVQRLSAISYALSGGYSKPQMYPDYFYPLLKRVDCLCDLFPSLFATRILIVMQKSDSRSSI